MRQLINTRFLLEKENVLYRFILDSQRPDYYTSLCYYSRDRSQKKSRDYHSEIIWDVFSDWCERLVFPRIAATNKSSVVILDRATYHSVLDEEDRLPVTTWNRARRIDAIRFWGGPEDDWPLTCKKKELKHHLLDFARSKYPSP